MRLVVLDTNVIVSAGIKPKSFPAEIVEIAIRGATIQIVVCPSIVSECRRVMRYSEFAQYGFPPKWLEFLVEGALRLPNPVAWPYSLPDPDDSIFLSLAHAAGAWLITGNLKHYPAASREDVVVRTPAEYVLGLTGQL